MAGMEDAANIFGAQLSGTPVPARGGGTSTADNFHDVVFDNRMEGESSDEDTPEGRPDEGGDAWEEERASRKPEREESQPRNAKTGQFMKNEGPIDDQEGDGEDHKEEEDDEGGEGGENDHARTGDRIAGVPSDTKIKVTIDGKEEEVTLKEATEGYIRTQTFHRRMTALDGDRQVVARERSEVSSMLQGQRKALEDIMLELKLAEPREPNWQEAYARDPVEASRQKALWDHYKDTKKGLIDQHASVMQQQAQLHQQNVSRFIQQEQKKILEKFPHWNDNAARERDSGAIKKTLKDAGFTDQEIGSLFDSRMVVIAMKAARFDRLASQSMPRRSNRKPMPAGSGASTRRSGSGNGNRALRDHAAHQTIESAASAMQSILDTEG